MYACPNCNAAANFMAFRDGVLIRVLEDREDVEGLDRIHELLCTECNQWFANPWKTVADRVLTGEIVTITGLKGKGTIKVVASGVKFPFKYDSYEAAAVAALGQQKQKFIQDLLEFSHHSDNSLCIRVKEAGNPNTWVYRLDKRGVKKALGHK